MARKIKKEKTLGEMNADELRDVWYNICKIVVSKLGKKQGKDNKLK